MHRYEFQLHISSDQYLDYYRGAVKGVAVRSNAGQNIQFPASLLQKFITKEGIHGNFVLTCDEAFKNPKLHRL